MAATQFNRTQGFYGTDGVDLKDPRADLRENIQEILGVVRHLAPILDILSGIFGSTSGAARSNASSMLFSALLGGMLTSGVNNPASHMAGNHGASHSGLGTAQALRQQAENIDQQDATNLRASGYNVSKPEPPVFKSRIEIVQEARRTASDAEINKVTIEATEKAKLEAEAKLLGLSVTGKATKAGKAAITPEAEITKYLNELDAKFVKSEKVRLTEYKGTKQEEAATTSRNIKLERDVITDLQGQGITDLSQCKGVASLLTGQYQTLDQLQKDRREMMMFVGPKNGAALKQVNLNIAEAELNIKTTLERNNLNSMEVSKYSLEKTAPVAPAAPEAVKSIFSHLISWISSRTITQLKTLV